MPAALTRTWANRTRRDLLVALAAATVTYLLFLGYRLDYLGHFLAGAGACLGLLVLLRLARAEHRWSAVGATALVVVASLVSERLWFGGLFYDWIDIANSTLGAALVSAAFLSGAPDDLDDASLWGLSALLVATGFLLRFGFGWLS